MAISISFDHGSFLGSITLKNPHTLQHMNGKNNSGSLGQFWIFAMPALGENFPRQFATAAHVSCIYIKQV